MSGTEKLTNKIEEMSGKGKQAVGDATDDRDLRAEGRKEESKGNLKQAGEKVKDAFKK
ncbi:CsbD-like [Blastococcus sp. DSM 46786]|uniref:CsbD family protein n=1 Tax=Blastococcus sp. DSM 46786 TaxID=1798227 RepID=UPI0008C3D9CA|nr:CsbD family protein [Blastococcus sp. DSM 46786]SEK77512.1 CsbD-like [Blastococcus sp. DSM 46786]